ncbi:MAG TPA: hypothetical protein VJT69_00320 [Pyrinomonadaceae bacterium]|nr:hypothetical protein [Pyrinomonadaceae bacterium]
MQSSNLVASTVDSNVQRWGKFPTRNCSVSETGLIVEIEYGYTKI